MSGSGPTRHGGNGQGDLEPSKFACLGRPRSASAYQRRTERPILATASPQGSFSALAVGPAPMVKDAPAAFPESWAGYLPSAKNCLKSDSFRRLFVRKPILRILRTPERSNTGSITA